MKWLLSPLMVLLIMNIGSAYVKPLDYHGVQLKYYSNDDCSEILDRVPKQYYEDLHTISVFNTHSSIKGTYNIAGVIYLRSGCDDYVLIHELAHHCQRIRGDSYALGLSHIGQFEECEDEIWKSYG